MEKEDCKFAVESHCPDNTLCLRSSQPYSNCDPMNCKYLEEGAEDCTQIPDSTQIQK